MMTPAHLLIGLVVALPVIIIQTILYFGYFYVYQDAIKIGAISRREAVQLVPSLMPALFVLLFGFIIVTGGYSYLSIFGISIAAVGAVWVAAIRLAGKRFDRLISHRLS